MMIPITMIHRVKTGLSLIAGMILLTIHAAPVRAQEDDNPRVSNVKGQYASIKSYGEILGFYQGVAPDPSLTKHWQGIQRSAGTGTPYLFVSRSGDNEAGKHANVAVVEMLSRNTDGGRFRSNRLNLTTQPLNTAPPAMDRVVHNIEFTDYNHAGGLQRIGNILAVPLEDPTNSTTNPKGKVVFYDVTNPRSPTRLAAEITADHNYGVVGIMKIPNDGRYLVALSWQRDQKIEFWRSNVTNLRDPSLSFEIKYIWDYTELVEGNWYWQTGTDQAPIRGTYQCLNFVVQTDGTIYMIGMRNDISSGGGADRMQLFRVTLLGDNVSITEERDISGNFMERHMTCRGGNGNFIAAGGVHITPNGELILYSTEHDNDGPNGCIKMGEFGLIQGGVTDKFAGAAWVELHDDTQFEGRKLLLDSRDRPYQNWNSLDTVESFNGMAESMMWYAPTGTTIRCYENVNSGGSYLELVGDGTLHVVQNLGDWNNRIKSVAIVAGDPGPTIIVPTVPFPDALTGFTALQLIGSKPYTRLKVYTGNYNIRPVVTSRTLIEGLGGNTVIGAP